MTQNLILLFIKTGEKKPYCNCYGCKMFRAPQPLCCSGLSICKSVACLSTKLPWQWFSAAFHPNCCAMVFRAPVAVIFPCCSHVVSLTALHLQILILQLRQVFKGSNCHRQPGRNNPFFLSFPTMWFQLLVYRRSSNNMYAQSLSTNLHAARSPKVWSNCR